MTNSIFIAASIDGYIADKNGEIDWLHTIPNPDNSDMGFTSHFENIDAMIMGRNTLDIVLNMDCEWPYSKPVFVLSNTMTSAPTGYENKIFLVKGALKEIVNQLNKQGYNNLYIDGVITIQNFLKEDLIDEMIITTIPILLGAGLPLFGSLDTAMKFKHIKCERFCDAIVQNHFVRFHDYKVK